MHVLIHLASFIQIIMTIKFIIIILSLKLTGASGRAVRCTSPVLACLLATELLHVLNNLRDAATCATRLNMTNQLNTDQRRYLTAELQINERVLEN
jgi:hypothetical protein